MPESHTRTSLSLACSSIPCVGVFAGRSRTRGEGEDKGRNGLKTSRQATQRNLGGKGDACRCFVLVVVVIVLVVVKPGRQSRVPTLSIF